MGFKIVRTEKKSKASKKKRKKIQHTKILLDILITSFVIVCASSLYINYKNGLGMDGILSNICDVLKWVLPSGCAKSVIETALEKKARLEYAEKGINYDEQ